MNSTKKWGGFAATALSFIVAACGAADNNAERDSLSDTATDQLVDTVADTATEGGADTNSDAINSTDSGTDNPQTSYVGFEEVYVLTNSDDPTDVCRVRYDLTAVGEPEAPCEVCEWDVTVEWSNPQVVVDLDGACANSALLLDEAAISAMVGTRAAYGFAR